MPRKLSVRRPQPRARKQAGSPEVELDLGRYQLRRNARPVQLARKPMELLLLLVSRREQLVSRDEIIAKLWRSDLFVDTESAVNNIVRKIRVALGDVSEKPRFLETVIGKGYRFIGPVHVIHARHVPSEASSSPRSVALSESNRTSLAVLPLAILGNSADDNGLGLGFADALISRLGNLNGIDVLPTSTVLPESPSASPADVALRLGVRFVVRGAMQSAKEQWHFSVEMFDAQLQRVSYEHNGQLDLNRLSESQDDIAKNIAATLDRQLGPAAPQSRPRYSKDPLAYADFMQGYRLSSGGDAARLDEATRHLDSSVTRDPSFSLAHATLSVVCATRHFEFDPARVWLEKAELHCQRALELDSELAEAHVARAFLLWGPSKNFQHLDAIAELKRALALQKNLPHAYNRLGTILAHIGLLGLAREMYQRGSLYHPKRAVSHSIVQAYMWNGDYELAAERIRQWRAESPGNKYPLYFAPLPAMMKGKWKEASALLDRALKALPDEPMIVSLQGVFLALTGKKQAALKCMTRACENPKSFGHAHHTYYQIASILSLLGKREAAFEWLERCVATGFACWPLFVKDPCLKNIRNLPEFQSLVGSLQAKYPHSLGLL
ncbi:MAG TPA: winged helix-turn-helix domain-containing protein [Candidatus Eisenbacteria bacterium]|jgi:DNA-binding winged helix-turn-helix (wHTH) protein/tetratricopeptide (TPR) repeat protein|nr:winged helix-turn-helix domain-containing protein [Candidatus Eisenbacteria bacterium]